MKSIFAALAVLTLMFIAGPANAHDTKSLHFHGEQLTHDFNGLHFHDEQLSHENGGLHFHDEQLSADKNQCFHSCIEQNGKTAKSSCAIQCGLASGAGGAGKPQRDCGTEYKRCKKACGKAKACKDQCRAARTSCY